MTIDIDLVYGRTNFGTETDSKHGPKFWNLLCATGTGIYA